LRHADRRRSHTEPRDCTPSRSRAGLWAVPPCARETKRRPPIVRLHLEGQGSARPIPPWLLARAPPPLLLPAHRPDHAILASEWPDPSRAANRRRSCGKFRRWEGGLARGKAGGEGGIRTHGGVAPTTVFECVRARTVACLLIPWAPFLHALSVIAIPANLR